MTKPILSLEAFRDFCLTKDPNEKYNFYSCHECAVGQYGRHLGLENIWSMEPFPHVCALNNIASETPHTFGALANRLALEIKA